MRILYVVTGAEYGGAVAHVAGLMRADIKQGHTVGLIAAPEKRLISESNNIGVQMFPNRFFVRRVKIQDDVRAIWTVFRAIRAFKPDIVSAHSTKAGYAARLACVLLRKPVVFTAHGWAFSAGQATWRRKLLPLAERMAALVTDRIICVSQYDLELALKLKVAPARKLALVHNGIDPQPFLNADGSGVRREFGLKNVTVLTMVARLAPPKDPLTLLSACKMLKGEFRCLIVGDGELRQEAEKLVSENQLGDKVIFTGERSDIPEILAASDVFILASYKEGLPLTIIEAGMAGLPVVASRAGGIPEIIQEGITGFTVPPGNAPDLAEVIQKLLDDADLRKKMGQAGREKTLKEFGFDQMYARTHGVYQEILKLKIKRQN
jgi:glycosyltransferase involved in cell wall biosynthesis